MRGVHAAVQTLLDESYRSQLDVEEVCRAFLDLAKAWSRRLIEMMYSDAGGARRHTQEQTGVYALIAWFCQP